MYNDVKKATEDRNAALETTLDVSEDFWTGLDGVKYQLQDVGGSLETEEKPALDPDHLREQQEKMKVFQLQNYQLYLLILTRLIFKQHLCIAYECHDVLQTLKNRLDEMDAEMTDVSKKGDMLTKLVGESEEPVVTTSIGGVSSEYSALRESWRQRLEQLQAAFDETNKFQGELVNILNWLQGGWSLNEQISYHSVWSMNRTDINMKYLVTVSFSSLLPYISHSGFVMFR